MKEFSRWQIQRARNDFGFFTDQFPYPPPVFKPVQMHRDWEDKLQNAYNKIHYILVLAGRGSAKSERVTISYPSWIIGKNPNLRISIVSNPLEKAMSFLSKISDRIENNDFYKACFGNLKPVNPKIWRTDAITVNRDFFSKDPSISAVGTMGQAVSKRADIIILDDPLDGENTKTAHQREGMIKWFYDTLDPILEPHGLLIAIMTPWHEQDLSQYLMKQSGWAKFKYPAIVDPDKNFDEWLNTDNSQLTAWPDKYGYLLPDTDERGDQILNPDGSPKMVSFLRNKYNSNIDTFMSQYLLNPYNVTGAMFNVEWLQYFTPEVWQDVIKNCVGFQGWDLAISLEERADFTAYCTLAWDRVNNRIYILDVNRDKLTPLDQFTAVQKYFHQWNPILPIQQVTIESDQYQKALSMGLVSATMLPIVESSSRGKAKLDRIGLLGPHFKNGRFQVSEFLRDGEFIHEYKVFPKGAHEDMLDCVAKCSEPILCQTGQGEFNIEEISMRPNQPVIMDINQIIRGMM